MLHTKGQEELQSQSLFPGLSRRKREEPEESGWGDFSSSCLQRSGSTREDCLAYSIYCWEAVRTVGIVEGKVLKPQDEHLQNTLESLTVPWNCVWQTGYQSHTAPQSAVVLGTQRPQLNAETDQKQCQ